MALATEKSAETFYDIVAATPIDNDFPLYAEDEVEVIYGFESLVAVPNTDYTVTLSDPDFDQFTITPTASLLTKINDLIAADEDAVEINYITVRRKLDMLTSVQPETVRGTPFLSRELERVHMRLIQLQEKLYRTLGLPAKLVGEESVIYEIGEPVEGFAAVWRGNKLVAEIDATNIAAAEGYASSAETALAATVVAKDAAEDAQVAAEAAAASIPLHNKTAVTAPTINDDSGDGYSVLSRWVNTAAVPDPEVYVCTNASVGAAVWVLDTLGIDDLGTAAVLNIVDEDNMASNSNSLLPTQQSVKAYVDSNASKPQYGFNVVMNASDPTNDIDFSAGGGWLSENNLVVFPAGLAMTKRLDASWSAGNNQGGLFSGSKANSTRYYLFAIYDPVNNIVDFGFDTSVTAANRPVAYTEWVWLGMVRTTAGGAIYEFYQEGDEFTYVTVDPESLGGTANAVFIDITSAFVPIGRVGLYIGNFAASANQGLYRPKGSSEITGRRVALSSSVPTFNKVKYDSAGTFQMQNSGSGTVTAVTVGFVCKRGRK